MAGDTLIVTQVGLDDSTNAALHGISVVLNAFKVGSAYGYTPTLSDTALHGSVLYSGGISSYSKDSQGNLLLSLNIDPTAGPFQFGEVGIYRDDGTLFALMAFPDLQNKYSSLGNNIASAFNFTCYLRLGQAGGVIEITAGGGGGGGPAFSYVLNSGQPPAVWGTTDAGITSQAWDPSNFNVSTAKHIDDTGASSHSYANDFTWKTSSAGSTLATLSGGGTFTATNLGTFSDRTLKENIQDLDDEWCLQRALELQGVRYDLISQRNDQDRRPFLGWIAQDVLEVVPELVTGFDCDGETKLMVMYGNAVAILTGAVRRLNQRIAELETT